ncbi:MAG: hypothetical protein J2P46_22910 [Zavarzinella sp.]|nr:hypothetical protein [Zavarzinella sp.]
MRRGFVCVAVALAGPVLGSEPDQDRVRMQLKSDNYTVTWGIPQALDPKAELEIGEGSGHGFTLGWLRFRPGTGSVDVLSIEFNAGRPPAPPKRLPKWEPDRAPVTVKRARMKLETYADLLRDLAVVDAATLKPVERDSFGFSSNDFWVQARLTADRKAMIDLDWAGYEGTASEVEYAKPGAVVALARASVEALDFKEHALTDEERGWASEKFARDWKKFRDEKFHWWVRERSIVTIGVVGDKAALPTLRDLLASDPPKDGLTDASAPRCVYYAINAVTRLTKKDVRDKPVEEMDLEKTRRKVLDALRDVK